MRLLRWLYPGLGIKRWLLLFMLGLGFVVLGGLLLVDVNALSVLEETVRGLVTAAEAGRDLPIWAAVLLIGLGIVTAVFALRQLVGAFIRGITDQPVELEDSELAERLYVRWHLNRGPRVVAIGGGTGLPVVLRGLKQYTDNITAIVTAADDGGSSGRLRGELGMLPPGDIRNCLVALADTEPLMERLLQHRFDQGSLAGHTVGNVLIGAMNDLSGDFRTAIRQLSRVLAVRGQVLPSVLEQVALRAELVDGSVVEGESRIGAVTTRIKRVELVPADSEPPPAAVKSLREADVVVIGPGSLYTSILPNLLVRELCAALVNSDALKLYVCNVMTQPGETEGYSAAAHLQALTDHVGENFLDHIIVNGEPISSALRERYAEEGAEPVQVDTAALLREGVQPVEAPVADQANYVRHDPVRLGEVIMRLVLQSEKALRRLSVFDIHLLQERYSVLRRERAK